MDDQERNQKGLLYLFERPYEPLTTPRANGTIQYQQTDGEDEATEESSDDSGPTVLKFQKLDNILDQMEMVKKVPKGVPFSQFDPVHLEAAKELTALFMEYADKPKTWEYAGAIKESVNEGVFIFSLSCAIIRTTELDSCMVPAIYEVFPNMCISQHCMDKCKERVKQSEPEIEEFDHKDFSGIHNSLEHSLAYWREDYGMNAHHWHWHLVFNDINHTLKQRDRKGEVFYYMHNQMLGRYDWERLSNGLPRVVPLDNWHEPIPEGYFSDLTINNNRTFKHYGGRPDNMTLRKDRIKFWDIETYRNRFRDAIQNGYMINKETGERFQLSDNVVPWEERENDEIKKHNKRGIDILGDTLEPSNLSVDISLNGRNLPYYGNLHGFGHAILSEIHDPDEHHGTNKGVMRHTETAMRDPVFYRWHKFIDDICQDYKMKQEPYEDKELVFDPILLESVSVKSGELDDNVLETGWTYSRIEVTRGLDFGSSNNNPIVVWSQHLAHNEFLYNLEVTNNENDPLDVTVRLYMAPKFNEEGEEMTYMDQRQLWAEMDRYQCRVDPGLNSLERSSMDSSITISDENTFRNLEKKPPVAGTPTAYCGCGWPQHLLLPKGTAEGMDFQIFALIDKVQESGGGKACSRASSYCGILDENYPDARPMGYPFDRRTNYTVNDTDIHSTADLESALPNAAMVDIKITFKDKDIFPESE